MSEAIRINRFIASCGLASRRKAEAIVLAGRVTINDHPVRDLATTVDPSHDVVKVDGSTVQPLEDMIYIMLNKPTGVLTTVSDPHGRPTVSGLVRDIRVPINPVGRLDMDTEGALLLTNDGELAFRLTHPRFQVPKVYEAIVQGNFTEEASARIAKGLPLEDGAIGHGEVTIVDAKETQSILHVTMKEGRKREVRQLCDQVGFPVIRLKRLSFGGVAVGEIEAGTYRHLTTDEVALLKTTVGLPTD